MGAALPAGADGAVLACHPARAGDAGGPARGAGMPACARTDVGSRGWAAAALSHRAGAASRQLHLAIGGAGVRDQQARHHGQPGDPGGEAGTAPAAWTLTGPGEGIRAADAGAVAARPTAG